MKYFLLFSGLELAAILIGFLKRPFSLIQWMSRNYTMALKGLSMLTILWSHVGACLGVKGIQFIGTIGVSLFIIFSGYGIQLSVEANGIENYWERRILHVALPYWIIEGLGLLLNGRLTFKTYLLDCLFIKPAVGPGWFMQYIMVCYLLYYLAIRGVQKLEPKKAERFEKNLLYGVFLIWFVIDSLFFADPAMPFLKARQMLCFPLGVSIARNRERCETFFNKHALFLVSGFIGFLFMGITQLSAVKEMPYLFQNALSLFTVFPLAIAVLSFTNRYSGLLNNWVFKQIGMVSYEIYLVHALTMEKLQPSLSSFGGFLALTAAGVWGLHMLIRKGNQIWSI